VGGTTQGGETKKYFPGKRDLEEPRRRITKGSSKGTPGNLVIPPSFPPNHLLDEERRVTNSGVRINESGGDVLITSGAFTSSGLERVSAPSPKGKTSCHPPKADLLKSAREALRSMVEQPNCEDAAGRNWREGLSRGHGASSHPRKNLL